MADREGATANNVPDLGRAITSQVAHVDLREALRKQLQLGALHARVGWPRAAQSAEAGLALQRGQLFGGRTCVQLEALPSGAACAVLLHNDQASALVDRVLGGPGKLGVAGKAGALSDAECGVLAYFAARCGAALQRFRVLDVGAVEDALAEPLGRAVLTWPVRLTSQELTLDLTLLLTSELPAGKYRVDVLVCDGLDESALVGLREGDLLVSEQWPILATTRGLEASVELRVSGCEERLTAVLQGDLLRVRGVTQRAGGKQAELVLGSLELTFAELAALASGEARSLSVNATAVLWLGEQAVVRGTLVHYQRAVALRVDELAPYSTR